CISLHDNDIDRCDACFKIGKTHQTNESNGVAHANEVPATIDTIGTYTASHTTHEYRQSQPTGLRRRTVGSRDGRTLYLGHVRRRDVEEVVDVVVHVIVVGVIVVGEVAVHVGDVDDVVVQSSRSKSFKAPARRFVGLRGTHQGFGQQHGKTHVERRQQHHINHTKPSTAAEALASRAHKSGLKQFQKNRKRPKRHAPASWAWRWAREDGPGGGSAGLGRAGLARAFGLEAEEAGGERCRRAARSGGDGAVGSMCAAWRSCGVRRRRPGLQAAARRSWVSRGRPGRRGRAGEARACAGETRRRAGGRARRRARERPEERAASGKREAEREEARPVVREEEARGADRARAAWGARAAPEKNGRRAAADAGGRREERKE
ncbi:hypothetical protein BRADI_4g25641v3, partial [Brachypodium distachyon]